jgi:SNF2 family DNA or RNA helicase
MDVLDQIGKGKLVVFSQFRQLVNLAEKRFQEAGIPYVVLHGGVANEDRHKVVNQFQNGRAQVIAATIATGGESIDLFASSTVMFTDRVPGRPDLNAQAEDRLHRAGQKNAVQVIDVIAKNTTDRGRHQQLELLKGWLLRLAGNVPIPKEEVSKAIHIVFGKEE